MLSKKRLLMGAATVATVGSIVALASGVTFGLFSATAAPQNNTFSSGTVSLGSPVSVSCSVSNMAPGDDSTGYLPDPAARTDAQTAPCTFQITYTGSLNAYVAVDLSTSGTSLYDGSANGLQFQIKDNNGGSYATGGVLNGGADLFVAKDNGGSNTVHTFTVNYALPLGSPNSYQGLNTTLTLTVHAVQAGNNGTSAGCTAGAVCGTITSWS